MSTIHDLNLSEMTKKKIRKMEMEAYNEGVNEAWKIARRICYYHECSDFRSDILYELFGTRMPSEIMKRFSCQGAQSKFKTFDEKEEIKVGDVVTFLGKPIIVTRVSEDKTKIDGFGMGGFVNHYDYNLCKKTDSHIDIQQIFKEIRKELKETEVNQ